MVSRDGAVKAARVVLTLDGTSSIFGPRRHPFALLSVGFIPEKYELVSFDLVLFTNVPIDLALSVVGCV